MKSIRLFFTQQSRCGFRLILAVCLMAAAGCGKSDRFEEQNKNTIEKHRPKFEALREELKAIAANLPKPGTTVVSTGKRPLEPKPLLNTSDGANNTEVFTHTQLLNPDPTEFRAPANPGKMLTCFGMLRTKIPFRNDMDMEPFFADALKIRYIVVLREALGPAIIIQPGDSANRQTFQDTSLVMEGFLVDLSSRAVLATTRVTVKPNEFYLTGKGRDGNQVAATQEAIDRDMRSKARDRVLQELNQLTNGTLN